MYHKFIVFGQNHLKKTKCGIILKNGKNVGRLDQRQDHHASPTCSASTQYMSRSGLKSFY